MIILIALLFFFPTQMPINFLLVSEMKNSKEKEKKRQTAHKYTKKQWQTIDARMRMPMIYFGEINFFEAAKRCTQYEPYKYINICTSFRDCRVRSFVRQCNFSKKIDKILLNNSKRWFRNGMKKFRVGLVAKGTVFKFNDYGVTFRKINWSTVDLDQ